MALVLISDSLIHHAAHCVIEKRRCQSGTDIHIYAAKKTQRNWDLYAKAVVDRSNSPDAHRDRDVLYTIENIVFQNQQQYYQAISQSTNATDCGFFVEFMLEEILTTLKKRQGKSLKREVNDTVNDTVNGTVNLIKSNPKITLDDLAQKLNKSRRTVTRIIKKLQDEGVVIRIGADKTGYWRVKDE